MAYTYYESINWHDGLGNPVSQEWSNLLKLDVAPYFYSGDIEVIMSQKFTYLGTNEVLSPESFQICPTMIPNTKGILKKGFSLVPLIKFNGKIIKITKITQYFSCDNMMTNPLDKNGKQVSSFDRNKVLVAVSCRPLNPKGKIFISNPIVKSNNIPTIGENAP